ncbi:hypothetical protein GCM10012284_03610 [Mangrovihabitans endophyticus]|uniref:Uncharacterized protein n=1 Tax=Mangrovihabitans endophyticus TaxID=1751298 RepID=A0A8J3BS17_9ACTN|nr:hypothetical protein GCM10012284_03610 [Mangrovihabitans endophyticus]
MSDVYERSQIPAAPVIDIELLVPVFEPRLNDRQAYYGPVLGFGRFEIRKAGLSPGGTGAACTPDES